MIKTIRLLCGLMAIAMVAFVASCSDDSDDIGGGGSVPVADGFYITKVDVTPVTSSRLVAEVVEADGFATQSRDGFFANHVYLTAGSYNVVNVIDQEIAQTIGGVATVENGATEANPDGTGSDCELYDYILVAEYAVDGAAFAVAEEGLYKVMLDSETKEIVLYLIESAQAIGGATEAGWAHSADLVLPVTGTASATGVTFSQTNVTLRPGEYKIRFNCRWIIDRRIDPLASPGHEFDNGYVALTNYGGTFAALVPGGPNFIIALGEDGLYTVTAAWTPAGGFAISATKTAPLDPIEFEPGDYNWGIIGEGGPSNSWGDPDVDLTYDGLGANGHSWSGTFALDGEGGFKFRTNDNWDFAPNANTYTAVTGDGAADIDATGNDFFCTPAGTHKITISTNDAGLTWAIDFDKQL